MFGCTFQLFYYPFDVQHCYLMLQLNVRKELVEFSSDRASVVYQEDPKLPAFVLSNYLIAVTEGGDDETRYSVLEVFVLEVYTGIYLDLVFVFCSHALGSSLSVFFGGNGIVS